MKRQTSKKTATERRNAVAAARARLLTKVLWERRTILAATAVVTMALLWLGGNIYGTRLRIGDSAVSGLRTDSQLEALIATRASSYYVTLKYPDGRSRRYSPDDLGVHIDSIASVAAARRVQAHSWQWIAWWHPVAVPLQTRIDATAFQHFIAERATIEVTPARNASLSLDGGKIVVSPGANGKQYSFTNPSHSLLSAVQTLRTTPLTLTTVAREPAISVHTLAPAQAQLEHILHQQIHIAMGNDTATPDTANIASWLKLAPAGHTMAIRIDPDELRGYLNTVASEHSKDPRSRVISDDSGAVLVAGSNGVKVTNNIEVDDPLMNTILQGGGAHWSMPVATTAFKTVQAPTAGKWIEVDTATKRMYAYDGGEVVRSFLVSAGAPGTPTVTGRYAIYAKYVSQDMFGSNTDGSRYFQPSVPYINYFYRDYAIHGNYWRPASYFGYINSSHGCVGVSVSEGAWIYSWAPVGTPVIVHT